MNKGIYRKAVKKVDALLASLDLEYDREVIAISEDKRLIIMVERIQENDHIYYGQPGSVLDLQFYIANKQGYELDGITVGIPFEKKYPADLAYLLNMYT